MTANPKDRTRRIELVLSDMKELKEKYDPVCIGFTDSSLSPKRIEDIADENIRTKNQMKFSALSVWRRLLNRYNSVKNCRRRIYRGHVGLESGSQKVNDIINKGLTLKMSS